MRTPEFEAIGLLPPSAYWESRARRYAGAGEGLAAVCSYGMPEFYNRYIQFCQQLALRRWLRVVPGSRALDLGCGVGRWTRSLARQGARVTGVDISATMVAEATARAAADGLGERCHFVAQDLADLHVPGPYDLIVGVTVLQHILDEHRLHRAVSKLVDHLAPGGRIVLLEVAPTRTARRCDSPIFRARDLDRYLTLFDACGLKLRALTGVDPLPLKTLLLPHYRALPKSAALAALAAVTALSLPIDAIFGRKLVDASWHKVFVLEHAARLPA